MKPLIISLVMFSGLPTEGPAQITSTHPSPAPSTAPDTTLAAPDLPDPANMDKRVEALMTQHSVPGLALALVEKGHVTRLKAYGFADREAGTKLETDHILYGASWTKSLFSMFVMHHVALGSIDLDTPITAYLKKPLDQYPRFTDLAGDARWRRLTLRMLLGHTTGFPNYRFFPPWSEFDRNAKLAFFRDPGAGYGYSGEGYYIAQQVMDDVLGRDSGGAMAEALFVPLGLQRTMLWFRDDMRPSLAKTYRRDGQPYARGLASDFAAAGSMDTTISDMATLMASFQRGDILDTALRAAMLAPHTAIHSAHQFPPWHPKTDTRNREIDLASAVGVITWQGARGRGFAKGGHDDGTDNFMLCLIAEERCLLAMMTTAKGDLVYPPLFDSLLPGHGYPWRWEYGNFTSDPD